MDPQTSASTEASLTGPSGDPLSPQETSHADWDRGLVKPLTAWRTRMARAKSVIFSATSPLPLQYFQYVNSRNIKLFAFFVIICFIIYHGIQRNYGNPDSCQWLLRTGRIQGSNLWQPNGCMMHTYTQAQTRTCIARRRHGKQANSLVFIGDSRMRFLYNQTVLHLTGSFPAYPPTGHSDITVIDSKLNTTLKFLWHPFVNEEMKSRVEELITGADRDYPSLVLVSSGTWTMKSTNETEKAYQGYRENVTALAPTLDGLARMTKVVWMLQEPVFEWRLSKSRSLLDSGKIGRYNWAAEEALKGSKVDIMYANHLVLYYTGDSEDGLHMGNDSLRQTIQILLNYHCNQAVHHKDATCCVVPAPLHSIQVATLSILTFFIIISCVLLVRQHGAGIIRNLTLHWKRQAVYSNGSFEMDYHDKPVTIKDARLGKKVKTSYEVFYETSFALAKLGLIMGYFVLCDRTDFFKKENKYYSNINFFVPLTYIFLVAIFFSENSEQAGLLHRDQTDEWKGWMQFVILVYHMTAGSTRLPIYMHVRVLVSSYLFLNGYAHFMYFWSKGDVSGYRFFQIVFRMNLLVFCLCLVMHSQYQFYYFVPLVTFWFIVTYLTMALPPRITEASTTQNPRHNLYMVLKFILLFTLITLLYTSRDLFNAIFLTKPWSELFKIGDSGDEWFFRWKLDRYSVLAGMVCGYLVCLARKYSLMNETLSENLFTLRKSVAVVAGGIVALLGYLVFALLCRDKTHCNEVHTLIVIIPILGFIAVRNTFGVVRRRFSTLFSWAGRLSLELFIVQFHVWLAADTYGILVFLPGYPVLNVVFTTFIYLCVAHEVNGVTAVLAEHLVPRDWKYLLFAVASFGLILGLLAVCYGL